LLVLALARPQTEKSQTREDARGINIMLALDFSGTMRTRDFFLDGRRVARTDGLRSVVAEFIRARPQDRLGLVTFDRDAWLASPLTLDHEWLLARLRTERNGTGTAIGSALVVAAGHLQEHTKETRVIVLVTDAENISAGPPPDEVAEASRPLGIRLHCIQLFNAQDAAWRNDLSDYLSRAAARTGGEYFRVQSGPDLRSVYSRIDRLEKQKLTDRRQKSYREQFPGLALPALGLLLLEITLAQTRWRRLP
jgi:Ca-activated chloride channel homolog